MSDGYRIVGRTITAIRVLTEEELEARGWAGGPEEVNYALVLDDGAIVYAASDSDPDGSLQGQIWVDAPTGEGGKLEGYTLDFGMA